jgi:uncharacterized DUF497 family protein
MKFVYTEHALARMEKRQLKQEWIECAVNNPARIEPDKDDAALEHRFVAVPELANRVLCVIVSKDEPRRVVTAHLERKMKNKL